MENKKVYFMNIDLLVKYQCPKCLQIYACECSGCQSIPTELPRVKLSFQGIKCKCGYHGDYSVPKDVIS